MTWTLVEAVARSPLVAIARRDTGDRRVLHAVTATSLASHTALQHPLVTACGQEAVLTSVEGELLPWPVHAKGIAPFRRCRACWEATGKRPPRTSLAVTRSLSAIATERWGVPAA